MPDGPCHYGLQRPQLTSWGPLSDTGLYVKVHIEMQLCGCGCVVGEEALCPGVLFSFLCSDSHQGKLK